MYIESVYNFQCEPTKTGTCQRRLETLTVSLSTNPVGPEILTYVEMSNARLFLIVFLFDLKLFSFRSYSKVLVYLISRPRTICVIPGQPGQVY